MQSPTKAHVAVSIAYLRGTAAAAAILAFTPLSSALAQTAHEARATSLEEIVVTARKREESLQETPIAVSAISAATLERNQLVSLNDLQTAAPGLVIFANPGQASTPTISLRGLAASDFSPANEYPLAIYIDGVFIARMQGAMLNLTDMERVEVLRGPQGTLNGRNSTAGSIALFTKGPQRNFGVAQKLSYASFNEITSRTTVDTGKLGKTGLSARVAYMYHRMDGYYDNTLTSRAHDPGADKSHSVFAALHGEWGDLRMDYKFDWINDKSSPIPTQITTATANVLAFYAAYNPTFRIYPGFHKVGTWRPMPDAINKAKGNSLNFAYDLSPEITLKSITGFRKLHNIYSSWQGVYTDSLVVGNVSVTGAAPFTIRPIDVSVIEAIDIRQKQYSQEFQLLGHMDRLSYVGGLYYFKEKTYDTYGTLGSVNTIVLSPTTARFGARSLNEFWTWVTSTAAYGQVSFTPPIFDDRLELTVGGRYTHDKKRLKQTQPTPGTALIPIPRDVHNRWSNFTGEGSIKYKWTDGIMTYVRVAQAFKSGGFSPRDTTYAVNGYGPEKMISYEVGLKGDFLSRRVRLNADAFSSHYKSIQLTQVFTQAQGCQSAATCSSLQNAGKARYNGLEAELTVIPVTGLQLNGGFALIDPKFLEYKSNPLASGDIAKLPTTKFSFMSKFTANASVEYIFPQTSYGTLSARVNWSKRTTRYFSNIVLPGSIAEQVRDPGHTQIDAQINLADMPLGAWRGGGGTAAIQVFGRNLTNKHTQLTGTDIGTYGVKGFGPGRTFGASINAQF